MLTVVILALTLGDEVEWLDSHEDALRRAKATGKPILLYEYNSS